MCYFDTQTVQILEHSFDSKLEHQIYLCCIFRKKNRHQTPDVSIPFAEKECLQTFYFPDTDLSGEVFYTDHNKKCLASTWKQSFDKYLQSVSAHLQYFLETRISTFYFMLRFSRICTSVVQLTFEIIYADTILWILSSTQLYIIFRNSCARIEK